MDSLIGTSGAKLVFGDYVVRKTVDSMSAPGAEDVLRRVIDQGLMMQRMGHSAFPTVFCVDGGGYIMERLHDVEWTARYSQGHIFRAMHAILATFIWGRRVKVRADWVLKGEHVMYVNERSRRWPDIQAWLARAISVVLTLDAVTMVQTTHGDPTVDNVMQRAEGGLVFIDPLPHDARMPNLMSVDIGKMLQSARGYEEVKYGAHPLEIGHEGHVLSACDDQDALLAKYFHVVHLVRLIPYQPTHLRRIFEDHARFLCGEYADDFR